MVSRLKLRWWQVLDGAMKAPFCLNHST